MRQYQVEICVDSAASAKVAEFHGADRVELCIQLDEDGLSPSSDLIAQTRSMISIGLYVMIRPHNHGFVYSESEIDQMIWEIQQAKELGADGIVSGALLSNGTIDVVSTQRLKKAAQPLDFTFHRAFDVTADPQSAFKQLDALGVQRLLTSGQKPMAIEGIELIKELGTKKSSMKIMAGSGVNSSNIEELWKAGVRQFHFTSHKADLQGNLNFDPEKTISAMNLLAKISTP